MNEYDAGVLNDWGGGNVGWWHDYLRCELANANQHWIEQTEQLRAELTEAKLLLEATREYVVDAIFATEHSLKGYEKLITQKTAPDRDLLREIDAAMAGGAK